MFHCPLIRASNVLSICSRFVKDKIHGAIVSDLKFWYTAATRREARPIQLPLPAHIGLDVEKLVPIENVMFRISQFKKYK